MEANLFNHGLYISFSKFVSSCKWQHLTRAGNLTVKTVTSFAQNPAKQAPFLPAVAAGVELSVELSVMRHKAWTE